MKIKDFFSLAAVLVVGCAQNPDDFPKHMLINQGLYQSGINSNHLFDFRKDGTGKEINEYPTQNDTITYYFTWNTSDWYKGTKVVEGEDYSMNSA